MNISNKNYLGNDSFTLLDLSVENKVKQSDPISFSSISEENITIETLVEKLKINILEKNKALLNQEPLYDKLDNLEEEIEKNKAQITSEKQSIIDMLTDQKKETKIKLKQLEETVVVCNKNFSKLEDKLCQEVNKHLGEHILEKKDLPLKFSGLSLSFLTAEETKRQVDYLKQKQIKSLENLIKFIKEAKKNLEEKKEFIFQIFGKGEIPDDIKISLKILGADSHHGGKTPLLVILNTEKAKSITIVYKPRGAETDKAIIDLFQSLNNLQAEHKSGSDLPVYKIEDLKTYSLWEYIEGEELGQYAYASLIALEQKKQEKKEKLLKEVKELLSEDKETLEKIEKEINMLKIAKTNLERLHCICSKAGITDLHQENVKLTGVKAIDKNKIEFIFEDREFKWVPIDLEIVEQVMQPGYMEQQKNQALQKC